jgi:hypothetical protein
MVYYAKVPETRWLRLKDYAKEIGGSVHSISKKAHQQGEKWWFPGLAFKTRKNPRAKWRYEFRWYELPHWSRALTMREVALATWIIKGYSKSWITDLTYPGKGKGKGLRVRKIMKEIKGLAEVLDEMVAAGAPLPIVLPYIGPEEVPAVVKRKKKRGKL